MSQGTTLKVDMPDLRDRDKRDDGWQSLKGMAEWFRKQTTTYPAPDTQEKPAE